jgi:hypothetical protein
VGQKQGAGFNRGRRLHGLDHYLLSSFLFARHPITNWTLRMQMVPVEAGIPALAWR